MRKFLRIGKIISLHGIKGEVKVFPTTDDIKRFNDLKDCFILTPSDAKDDEFEDKESFKVIGVKYIKNTCILKIDGFEKIEDSSKLIGKNIYVSRENAIRLKSGEYYVMDLIGLEVFENDKFLGTVKDIMRSKAYSTLVMDSNNKEILIPLVSDFIEKVDIEKSVIQIKTIEGLL